MPWKNFLEKEPPSSCSRNEHLPLHNPRGTKTAPHNHFPCSIPHVHCAMALQQHKILQMQEESMNKHHFMALIPAKPWEFLWLLSLSDYYLSALNCTLSGHRRALCKHRSLCLSKWQHTIWSGACPCVTKPYLLPCVPLGQKCVLMPPKKFQSVLMDPAQGGQGRRAQELSHFSLCTRFWGSRGSELCKSPNIYLTGQIKSR